MYDEDPSDGQRLFGVEQVRFAVKALDTHTDVRHTFVFMHKPVWLEDSEEWQQIEDALAGRSCSVFAGHQHKLKYELRNGGRYIVHGATGGSLDPSDVKELGQFHHYTLVTVDGNSVYLSIEEPGHAWPEDIAPIGFSYCARLIDSTEYKIRTLDDGRVAVDLGFGLYNALPKPVDFFIRPVIPPECAWHASVDSVGVHLVPESREWVRVTFTCPADDRAPVLAYTYFSMYDGNEMYRRWVYSGESVSRYTDAHRVGLASCRPVRYSTSCHGTPSRRSSTWSSRYVRATWAGRRLVGRGNVRGSRKNIPLADGVCRSRQT